MFVRKKNTMTMKCVDNRTLNLLSLSLLFYFDLRWREGERVTSLYLGTFPRMGTIDISMTGVNGVVIFRGEK